MSYDYRAHFGEVTLTQDLPGRTSSYRVAEVRARVNGIVQKRLFKEGSDVKEGQVLERGERIGLMKFGSRMDVFLPTDATLVVSAGDRAVGGETVLAMLENDRAR